MSPPETGIDMAERMTNVADFLLEGKDPGRTALLFLGKHYSYGELRTRVDNIANAIIAMGGRKGDRALLMGESSWLWVTSYLGILRAGLVCVPLSGRISAAELGYVERITEARFAFGEAEKIDSGKMRIVRDSEIDALPGRTRSAVDFPVIDADDLAALMFTSGSTGQPRGVMVSHGNVVANTESIVRYLGLTADDRMMTVLPFYYCFGTSLLHTHLRAGGSLVIEPRFMYPESVLQTMIDTGCTGFAGVPSHFQLLLKNSSLRKKTFPRLRHVQQAGGHLPRETVQELCAALPSTRVFVMYGQTEATARLSYLPPEFLPAKLGSIGRGIPGVSLRVLNESGQEVRPGQVGEIVARGPNIALGYWQAPVETAATFRDGALYTGDLATVDDDGFIYIIDRAKDFIKCGGERVSCRRIEDELLACNEVLEAAVIGVPDEILGESAKAFVVPCAPAAAGLENRLATHCKRRLPPPFVPKQIVLLRALPKNGAGKVLKSHLKTSAYCGAGLRPAQPAEEAGFTDPLRSH